MVKFEEKLGMGLHLDGIHFFSIFKNHLDFHHCIIFASLIFFLSQVDFPEIINS